MLSYDPAVITPDKLVELLAKHGHIGLPDSTRAGPGRAWAGKLSEVTTGWLIDAVAERLAFVVIAEFFACCMQTR